jgi:hypothetical protein
MLIMKSLFRQGLLQKIFDGIKIYTFVVMEKTCWSIRLLTGRREGLRWLRKGHCKNILYNLNCPDIFLVVH